MTYVGALVIVGVFVATFCLGGALMQLLLVRDRRNRRRDVLRMAGLRYTPRPSDADAGASPRGRDGQDAATR